MCDTANHIAHNSFLPQHNFKRPVHTDEPVTNSEFFQAVAAVNARASLCGQITRHTAGLHDAWDVALVDQFQNAGFLGQSDTGGEQFFDPFLLSDNHPRRESHGTFGEKRFFDGIMCAFFCENQRHGAKQILVAVLIPFAGMNIAVAMEPKIPLFAPLRYNRIIRRSVEHLDAVQVSVFAGFFNFIVESHRLAAFDAKRSLIGCPVNPTGMIPVNISTLIGGDGGHFPPIVHYGGDRVDVLHKMGVEMPFALNADLAVAYTLKEQLAEIWEAEDEEEAMQIMGDWIADAEWSEIPEMLHFAKTLRYHYLAILNYHYCPITTGPLEGLNNKINRKTACRNMKTNRYGRSF